MMMHGIAFKGDQHNAPIVNIGSPSPSNGVAGTVVIEWAITYTGTVTLYHFDDEIVTTASSATGTWVIIDGTTSTPKVRFTTTVGSGGTAKFIVGIGAVYNSGVANIASGYSPTASVSATPPAVTIGSPSSASGVEGSSVIDWDVSYSSWADTYSLITSEITANYTGSTAGTFEIIDGTTSTPVIRFTSSTGSGTVGFDVLAGAAQSQTVDNASSSPSTTSTVTALPVSISIGSGSPNPIATQPVSLNLDWACTISNAKSHDLEASDVTVTASTAYASGTATIVNGGTSSPTIRIANAAGTGWLSVHINANTYQDDDDVWNTASSESNQVTLTPITPVVNIGSPSPSSGEEGTVVISWNITYTGSVSDLSLATSDLGASYTGTTAGTWSVVAGTTTTPTVKFTSTTGFGTVKFRVNASAVTNWGVGNAQTAYSTAATIDEDDGK